MEGREEGAREERTRNARRMKELGYPPEAIADITGLSAEEVGRLS